MLTKVVLVGGFLGAGKTTLLSRAARLLSDRGRRVAIITNDQSMNLVDTHLLQSAGFSVGEVTGGCFCCRFDDLINTAETLVQHGQPDVLLGEPVGSCTDLSATVLQPFKKFHRGQFDVVPFSVLVDPFRLIEAMSSPEDAAFSEKVIYIYNKQLEEADLIVVNKIDLLMPTQVTDLKRLLASRYPSTKTLFISAARGDGVEEWLEAVMKGDPCGRRIAEVDYDVYADGEAELGWLNASLSLSAQTPVEWPAFGRELMERIRTQCATRSAAIAHLKLLISAGDEQLIANLTSSVGQPMVRGKIGGQPSSVNLIINARVAMAPDELKDLIAEGVTTVAGEHINVRWDEAACFSPSRPTPTHRLQTVEA